MASLSFTFDPAGIPRGLLPSLPALDELRGIRQWVAWDYVIVEGRDEPTKVPFNPATGRKAATNAPGTWSSYEAAETRAVDHDMAGVGFVLRKGGGLIGIDLDKCITDDGQIAPWAAEVVAFAETYAEKSPSGRGIRLFARGELDAAVTLKPAGVEMYDWGRYLTVTGNHIAGTPEDIREAPRTVAALRARVERVRSAEAATPPASPAPSGGPAPAGPGFFRAVNDACLAELSWVPSIFPGARWMPGTRSYRVSSRELGRDLEEDLSIAANGIVDFGVHDMGDPRGGKRTPIDIVMEHGGAPNAADAALWLCRSIGRSPESLGWEADTPSRLDGKAIAERLTGGGEAGAHAPVARTAAPAEPLETFLASDLHGTPVPEREWHVRDIIPAHDITLFMGDGGTGKSLVALQLAVATASAAQWIGHDVQAGRVLYLSAEDGRDELHRRLADIAEARKIELSALSGLMVTPLAGRDAVLSALTGKGLMQATDLWRRVYAVVEQWKPNLVILDTLADLFGGDENSKVQARQFIQMLRGMSIYCRTTTVLLGHPSLSGMSSGTGMSGSVAWNNSVRSRLYMRRIMIEDKGSKEITEPDPDIRVLSTMKANYGPRGMEIRLRWADGVFAPEEDSSNVFAGANRLIHAENTFLFLLRRYDVEGRHVGAVPSGNYAPIVFARDVRSGGLTQAVFETAMNRLMEAERIKVITFGPPSRRLRKIVAVEDEEPTPED